MRSLIILALFSAQLFSIQLFSHIMFVNDPSDTEFSRVEGRNLYGNVTESGINGKFAVLASFTLNTNSSEEISALEKTSSVIPVGYYLGQNSSRLAGSVTSIYFSIPLKQHVRLVVVNMLGQEITQLINDDVEEGTYKVNFDASKVVSGLYICRLETEKFVDSKRMTLVK